MFRNIASLVAVICSSVLLLNFYGYIDLTSFLTLQYLQYACGIGGMIWALPELWIYRKNDGIFNVLAFVSGAFAILIVSFSYEGIALSMGYLWVFLGATAISVVAEMVSD